MSRLLRLGAYLQQSTTVQKSLRALGLSGLAYSVYRRFATSTANGGWQTVTVYDSTVEVDNDLDPMHITDELPILEDLVETVRPDDVFWDVGANVGLFTATVGKATPANHIIAVEPIPSSQSQLEDTATHNNVSYELVGHPLTETPKTVTMTTDQHGNNKIAKAVDGENLIKLDAVPGSHLIDEKGFQPPDILKIDVEGAEMDVLLGMDGILGESSMLKSICLVLPASGGSFRRSDGNIPLS